MKLEIHFYNTQTTFVTEMEKLDFDNLTESVINKSNIYSKIVNEGKILLLFKPVDVAQIFVLEEEETDEV